jgi:photosystem II stability/assembly factor-like uncharacterized protein
VGLDPSQPQRLWVTFSDSSGKIFRSDTGGSAWTNCTSGLPSIPLNAVAVDPLNTQRVWVAAEVGVYETTDLGATWAAFSNGLPNAVAADLIVHAKDRRLFCATRSRGAWVIPI